MKPLMLAVLISTCLPTAFAKETAARLPTLAVTVSAQAPDAPSRENLEDLLAIELGNQRFLQLVDRKHIRVILKEHAIALSKLKDTASAVAQGKFAGADYLLHVLLSGKDGSLRLVEVATGQVKLEQQFALAGDLPLVAASVREKVLAAVQPESQAAHRLTVGIAGFPNRSGTGRSDNLGVDLQTALRKRLRDQPWAVVLERQYPTSLLEEVDLARMGLVRDKTTETLPPADLVVLGTMQDVDNSYVAGKPWKVELDVTFRLRGQARQISQIFASDSAEAVAGKIAASIDEFRRNLAAPQTAVSEKELWRRQGLYLMPSSGRPQVLGIQGYIDKRSLNDTVEMLRAWENVLLLDADDAEAMFNAGLCRIALYQRDDIAGFLAAAPSRQEALRQLTVGVQLMERSLPVQPVPERAASFFFCAMTFKYLAPDLAKEMAQYMADHHQLFAALPKLYWDQIDLLRKAPVFKADDSLRTYYAELDLAIRNAEKNPGGIVLSFERFQSAGKGSPEENMAFLTQYLDWPDPVVQFVVQKKMGDLLCGQKRDPAGLKHFDRAIELMEAAGKRLASLPGMALHGIYRFKFIACDQCGRPEEAKPTVLAGARHFLKTGESDFDTAWLYHYCVTKILGDGDQREALAMCNAYLAGTSGRVRFVRAETPRVFAKREELLAKLAGRHVPGLGGLRLAGGTGSDSCRQLLRLAATEDRIWLADPVIEFTVEDLAKTYRPSLDSTERLSDVKEGIWVYCVAATKDAVYFGSFRDGLYKFDGSGRLVKHFSAKDGSFPLTRIVDLREGGGKIYMSYCAGSRYGVAMMDPASDSLTVLAPTSRDAKPETEPVADVARVWWDAVAGRPYASCQAPNGYRSYPQFFCQYGLLPDGKTWHRYQGPEAPRFIVSEGKESLFVRIRGKEVEFSFSRSGQKLVAEVPLPSLMGDAAWDEHRIWVPTAAGLYEIDRDTARVAWVSYQNDNPFFSALKHGNRLYIATGRGLYYRDIPAMKVK